MNPLLVVSLPLVGALSWRRRWSYSPSLAWSIAAVVVAFGVLRNLPLPAAIILGPH